ncbi:MAG: hypothetical protein M3541_10815 [Acidobacteriota bacterium]|nr:hypothetical protein [Acidobacteriota bacterium]
MPRRIWMVVVTVVGTAATALLFSQPHASDADMPLTVVTPVPAPDVQILHEYITIAPAQPRPGPSPRLSSVSASASSSATTPSRARRSRPTERALLSKVARAVAGDGRYRPEPFPRLDRGR